VAKLLLLLLASSPEITQVGQVSNFLYSVEREYNVSIDAVWNAWADPEALSVWYCPTDLSVLAGSVVNEPVVGGLWTVGVDVKVHYFVAYFYGQYTAVEVKKKLVHTMHYVENADDFAARDMTTPSHEVVVEFEDRGGAAWVKFSQFGELPEGHAPRAQAGMESYFDNLGKYLGV
jgi:uncharacterized protein YndB with AHSA1/START domain